MTVPDRRVTRRLDPFVQGEEPDPLAPTFTTATGTPLDDIDGWTAVGTFRRPNGTILTVDGTVEGAAAVIPFPELDETGVWYAEATIDNGESGVGARRFVSNLYVFAVGDPLTGDPGPPPDSDGWVLLSEFEAHEALLGVPGGHLPVGTPEDLDVVTWDAGQGIAVWAAQSGGGPGGAVNSVNGRTGNVTGLAEQSALTAEATTRGSADTALSGRIGTIEGLGTLATAAALASEAALARNADNLTSGTVADARIASTIARDSELAAEATLARNADNLTSGTVNDARIPAGITRDTELAAAVLVETNARAADVDAEESARIAADLLLVPLASVGAANGVVPLDGSSLIPTSYLPALAITDTFVVASQAAMLALTAERGDVAIRSDLSKSFILQAAPASTLGNWKELLTPTDVVSSVDGRSGAVSLSDLYDAAGAAAAAQAFAIQRINHSGSQAISTVTGLQTALDAKANADATGITASTWRTALGLGTAATTAATAYATAAQGATADTAVQPARTVTAGTGLTGGGSLAADRTLTADFGAVAGKVTQGNDARLSDARTPTAHAASHAAAGGDAVTLAQSQITGLTAALAAKQTQDSDLDEIAALTDPTTYRNLGNNAGTWGFQRPAAVAAESHSTTSISNSTTETTLADLIIPGGSVAAGDLVRLSVWGDVPQSSGGAVTYQWRLKIGSTTVADTLAQSVGTASGTRKIHLVAEILMESTTAERIGGFMNLSSNSSGTWAGNGATFTAIGAAAEDTATDKHVLFTVQMGSANASAGVNVYGSTLEIIKKRDLA